MQLSGTSASPGKSFQKDKGYCEEETTVCISQRKKKKILSGEKWVNRIQRIGAEMENQICTDPKLCECSLLSVLSDSFIGFPSYFCFAGAMCSAL